MNDDKNLYRGKRVDKVYDGICFSCKRFIANGMPYGFCDSTITRPPQSYMYVEEL